MDALERLTAEELQEPTLLSAHHLHRYHPAASLCGGARVLDLGCGIGYGAKLLADGRAAAVLGVDVDAAAVEEAARRFGGGVVSFETADAVEALRTLDAEVVDVIVAFEVLEHLERFGETMDLLGELASKGIRLVLSVPNSRAFGERNEFHVTDFDYDSAMEAFGRFDGVRLLFQHLAEGSVILGAGDRIAGRVEAGLHGEPEYANTFIAAVGFDEVDVEAAVAQLNLVVTPNHNRYMLGLQLSNEELRRANYRLAREWLGKSDAAAASIVGRYQDAEARLTSRVEQLERRVQELTTEVLQVGDERAELQQAYNKISRKKLVRAALVVDSLRPSQRRR